MELPGSRITRCLGDLFLVCLGCDGKPAQPGGKPCLGSYSSAWPPIKPLADGCFPGWPRPRKSGFLSELGSRKGAAFQMACQYIYYPF